MFWLFVTSVLVVLLVLLHRAKGGAVAAETATGGVGMGVPALDVGFPEQEDQGGKADEHGDGLQKQGSGAVHGQGGCPRFMKR